jgi:endoglucanase
LQTPLNQILDFVSGHGFNAIRLPFSLAMALDLNRKNDKWIVDDDLRGLPTAELLSRFIDRCAERGLMVMLDMHRLNELEISELWYDDEYTEAEVLQGWDNILDVCKDKWNVFALDIKNEPHGIASWGLKCEQDWNTGAETITNHIIANHPEFRGLFFIEGISSTVSPHHLNRSIARRRRQPPEHRNVQPVGFAVKSHSGSSRAWCHYLAQRSLGRGWIPHELFP